MSVVDLVETEAAGSWFVKVADVSQQAVLWLDWSSNLAHCDALETIQHDWPISVLAGLVVSLRFWMIRTEKVGNLIKRKTKSKKQKKTTINTILTYMAQTFCPDWFPPSASYSPTLISDCMLHRFDIRLSALAMAVIDANFFTIL